MAGQPAGGQPMGGRPEMPSGGGDIGAGAMAGRQASSGGEMEGSGGQVVAGQPVVGGGNTAGDMAGMAASGGEPSNGGESGGTTGDSEPVTTRIKLDPERVVYMGHSQGGKWAAVSRYEKHVLAGVLSAAGRHFHLHRAKDEAS